MFRKTNSTSGVHIFHTNARLSKMYGVQTSDARGIRFWMFFRFQRFGVSAIWTNSRHFASPCDWPRRNQHANVTLCDFQIQFFWIKQNSNWIWSELHISSYFYIPYHSIRSRQCGFLSCLQFHFAELNFPLISPLISVLAVFPSCDQPIGHASSTVISSDDLPTQTRSKHGKPVIRKCEMTLDHVMIMLEVLKISLCITDDNQGNVWQALIACPSVSTWRDRTFSSKCSQQR